MQNLHVKSRWTVALTKPYSQTGLGQNPQNTSYPSRGTEFRKKVTEPITPSEGYVMLE